MKLRSGRHNEYTLYVQWGDAPQASLAPDGDTFLGAVRTPGFAHLLVEAVNAHIVTLDAEALAAYRTAWAEAEYDE